MTKIKTEVQSVLTEAFVGKTTTVGDKSMQTETMVLNAIADAVGAFAKENGIVTNKEVRTAVAQTAFDKFAFVVETATKTKSEINEIASDILDAVFVKGMLEPLAEGQTVKTPVMKMVPVIIEDDKRTMQTHLRNKEGELINGGVGTRNNRVSFKATKATKEAIKPLRA